MKKTIKIIKKSFFISIICLEIIMLNVTPAQAVLGSLIGGILGTKGSASGNANGMLEQMEQRYHLNKDSIKSFGESFNVSDQKQIAPEVRIMFSPQKPKLGEKVTATAYATGFQDGAEDLYFVWYLKHKGCSGENANLALCDANKNREFSESDWIVEAMRINATNGFDSSTADYSSGDNDNDGFKATLGGNNNRQGNERTKENYRCYINDNETGKNFELASVEGMDEIDEFECDGVRLCTSPYLISCIEGRVDVPEQHLGSISGTGGEGGEGGAGGTDGEGGDGGSGGSAGTISGDFAIPKHEEHYTGFRSTGVTDSGYEPYCDPKTKKATCPEGTDARCIEGFKEECFELDPTDDRICTDCSISCPADEYPVRVESSSFIDPTCEFMTMIISKYGRYTEVLSDPGETDISCSTTVASEDNVDKEDQCKHYFARTEGLKWWDSLGRERELRSGVGDDDFEVDEEEFWGTDPHKFSTAGNGKSDEANVAGLGADTFTWTYMPGDEIGVIVEGSSFLTTKHDDASKAITFALPKNIFQKNGTACKLENEEIYSKPIKGYDVEIPVAELDIMECLQFNLVDPNNGDHAGTLKTELSYSPENPNVGSNKLNGGGIAGDTLIVTANTPNLNLDNNEVYYKWSIFGTEKSREELSLLQGEEGGWRKLVFDPEDDDYDSDDVILFKNMTGITAMEGLGMDEFKINLNNEKIRIGTQEKGIFDGIKYLRVFVEMEEYYGDDSLGMTGTTSSGRSDVIIPINNTGDGNDLKISVGDNSDVCATASGACEVLNNQIIKAEIPAGQGRNFLWTLNGKKIEYLEGAEVKQGNTVKFLVQGKPGETFLLNVLANDTNTPNTGTGNSGEKLNFSRNLVVVNPMVALGPNNEINRGSEGVTGCKNLNDEITSPLGYYENPEGDPIADCKESVFDASGSFEVPISYYPAFIEGEVNRNIYVNGVSQGDNRNVDLSAYPAGSIVSVSVEAELNRFDDGELNELANEWGVSYAESTAKEKFSDTIFVRVKESEPQTVGKKTSKIIAGLAYNLPRQMIFVFKMLLTVGVIIFTSGVLMSLTKRKYI